MHASNYGKLDVVKFLADNGANIDEKNVYENTSLILASMNGHIDVIKFLLDNRADFTIKNKNTFSYFNLV